MGITCMNCWYIKLTRLTIIIDNTIIIGDSMVRCVDHSFTRLAWGVGGLTILESLTLSVKTAFVFIGKTMGERGNMRVHPSTK